MKVVARLIQALMLIAGLLWSGLCVAQCRVLPSSAKAAKKQGTKQVPPCHQNQEKAPTQDDCKDDGCTVSYADAEKSFDLDLAVGAVAAGGAGPIVDAGGLVLTSRIVPIPPSRSISVLRI
jgi:hypothetical protein